MNGKPIGRFVGSRMTVGRYWEGGCTCGSGEDGREFHDRMGIYCGITCSVCHKDDPGKWAPGIMTDDAPYDVEEQIDEDK